MNALFFTAYDRMDYLRQTLDSWSNVRGIQDWHVVFRIEPSERQEDAAYLFQRFAAQAQLPSWEIITNPTRLGVLEHPYVGFSELFQRFNFVVRAEDDLLVSDDILEYFTWAEKTYRNEIDVATINAFSKISGTDDGVFRQQRFNPWIWGTWRTVWETLLEPTWDHDYSSFNGVPGVESGWDWNIDTRLLSRFDYYCIYPENSRVQNIGLWGIHGTPDNLLTAESFKPVYGRRDYRESD